MSPVVPERIEVIRQRHEVDQRIDAALNVVKAHARGEHLPHCDHAATCGPCELEVVKVELKYAQQKLHKIGEFARDWCGDTAPEHARWMADTVQHLVAKPGCCCCPVGCVECDLGDCECYMHGEDHDTRCLGAPSTPERRNAVADSPGPGWTPPTVADALHGATAMAKAAAGSAWRLCLHDESRTCANCQPSTSDTSEATP